MLVKTRYFGEIDLDENMVITFEQGILGFEDYKRFTLLYNSDAEDRPAISWLQSVDEQSIALPVMIPTLVKPDYNPIINDEVLAVIGEWKEEDLSVLVTVNVPSDLSKMTTNMKAPVIINTETKKGIQVIAENPDYEIKYRIYDLLMAAREAKEGNIC